MTNLTPQTVMTDAGPIQMLTQKQRDVMRAAILEKKHVPRAYQANFLADTCRFRRLRWSRQTGKSYTMGEDAVLMAGETSSNVMQLSASADLTKELILKTAMHAEVLEDISGEIQRAILEGSLDEVLYTDEHGIKITQTTVTLQNGQRVIGRPANPRTARGFTCHVQLDEFGLHKDSDEIWAAAYGSISSDDSLRMTVASTPKGKKGRFYQICKADTVEQGGVWSDHTMTIYDAVRLGLKVNPEQLKVGLDDDQLWDQEYMVMFIDEASSFLTYDMIRRCEHEGIKVTRIAVTEADEQGDKSAVETRLEAMLSLEKIIDLSVFKGGELFLGVDIGRRRDLTVFWLFEKCGDVLVVRACVELYRVPFRHQQKLGIRIIGELNVRRACVDETGIGMMLAENWAFEFGKNKVEGIYFTEEAKARLAEQLRPKFVDQQILIPLDARVREDLHGINKLESAGGHARYLGEKSGTKGAIHPDHFWGCALGVNAAIAAPVIELTDKNVVTVSRNQFQKGVLV